VLVELPEATRRVKEVDVENMYECDCLEKPMYTPRVAQRDLYGIMRFFALAWWYVRCAAWNSRVKRRCGFAWCGLARLIGQLMGVFLPNWTLVRFGLWRLRTEMAWHGVSQIARKRGESGWRQRHTRFVPVSFMRS
jgi:hypothetical protein